MTMSRLRSRIAAFVLVAALLASPFALASILKARVGTSTDGYGRILKFVDSASVTWSLSNTGTSGLNGVTSLTATATGGGSYAQIGFSSSVTTSGRYLGRYYNGTAGSAVAAQYIIRLTKAGTMSLAYANVNTAPGGSDTTTFTVYHATSMAGLAATSIVATVTGSATTGADTTHTKAVAAGDFVAVYVTYTGNAPNNCSLEINLGA